MGYVYDFFKGIADGIPVLARKIGAVLISFFALGILLGWYLATNDANALFFIPAIFVAIIWIWHDLDEGFLIFLLFLLVAILFPTII